MLRPTLALLALLAATARASTLAIASCSADKLTSAKQACDSLVDISQIRCDNADCHKALHVLTDPEYIACYEQLKLGNKTDLAKYQELDAFCHGEGSDPTEKHDHDHEGSHHDDHDGSDHDHHDHDHGAKNATPSVTSAPATVPTPSPSSEAPATAFTLAAVSLVGTVAALAV